MSESIYNLVPQEYYPEPKRQMHRSVHRHDVVIPGSTFGCHGTTRLPGAGRVDMKEGAIFGPPSANNLTVVRKTHPAPSTSHEESMRFRQEHRKPGLPSKDDKPILGIKTNKNFVVANAVEAILQVPKKVGSDDLEYTKKEDFGKVPAYLTKVKEEIRRENEMIQKYVKEQLGEIEAEPEQIEQMSEDERLDLLDALKRKWEFTNAKYQKITHLVLLTTAGEVRRKEELEAELTRIENDIEKLQRPGPLLIRK